MRVLQIIDGYSFGGIAKLMNDISNNINDIDIDFLSATNINDNWYNLGISRKNLKGKFIYNHRLRKFLKNNKYDIIHINSAVFLFSFQVVFIARLSGIKRIVVHSHNVPNNNLVRRILIKFLNPLYRKITSVHLTCSNAAAKALYTKTDDVILLKNGIDIDDYKYDENNRKEIRKKLNIDKKIVYGHIGRFEKQKNHEFLVDLFYELQKKNDSVLLLVGEGSLEKNIRNKVKELDIENKVLFLGYKKDIGKLLSAMDIFIFPSLYEGLGISVIEAQTSGLPTIVSRSIPKEANISSNFKKIDTYEIKDWIEVINSVKTNKREKCYKDTIKNGYDIKKTSKELSKIYKELMKW